MAELYRPGLARLNAVATPVDTFVSPSRGAEAMRPADTNPLLDLASFLKTVQPSLDRWLTQGLEERRKEDEAQGVAAFAKGDVSGIEANRLGWKELIDRERKNDEVNGTDNAERLASMSPHFKRGYMKAQMDSMGMVFEDELLTQWNQNPEVELPNGTKVQLHQTDDPVALATWMQSVQRGFMEKHGLNKTDEVTLAESFLPRVRGAMQGMAARHNEFRLQSQQEEYEQAFGQNVQMVLGGVAATRQYDEGLAALQKRLDEAVKDGLHPSKANKALVGAVVTAYSETGDSRVLDLLQGVDTGHGPLGNVAWVKDAAQRAKDAYETKSQATERFNAWKESEAREAALRATMNKAARALLTDPSTDISGFTDQLVKSGNWAQALSLSATQDQLLDRQNAVRPNHKAIAELRGRVSRATTDTERRELTDEIVGRVGKDYDSNWAVRLLDDIDNAKRYSDVFNDSHVAGWEVDIERRIDARFVDPTTKEVYDDTRGKEAALLFRDNLTDWIKAESANGTQPPQAEIRAKADELGAAILRNERFRLDEKNMPKPGEGVLRTTAEQKSLGTEPTLNTIQSVLTAPKGAIQFNPKTLAPQDIDYLMHDHKANGQHSLLSAIAARQGMDPVAVAMAITGSPSDPFAKPVAQAPAKPEVPALQLEADPEMVSDVLDVVTAGYDQRLMGGVNLGHAETPLVKALQSRGVVESVVDGRNGTLYRVNYDKAVSLLQPSIQKWGQDAGVDTRLLEPGRLVLHKNDPLLAIVKQADNAHYTHGVSLYTEDKLRVILNLLRNATE